MCCYLVIFQDKVEYEAPEGGEVNVELSIRGDIGDEEDHYEDHRVGVGYHKPVGNVFWEHFYQWIRLHGLPGGWWDYGQGWGRGVLVSI